jgi:hypothetical protein
VRSGTVNAMDTTVELLLLDAVTRHCPDCGDERIFVAADCERPEACEFCCTTCGAALLVDPLFDYSVRTSRVA